MSSSTPDAAKQADSRINEGLKAWQEAAGAYETTLHETAEQEAYARIQTLMPKYRELDTRARSLVATGRAQEAADLLSGRGAALRESLDKELTTITNVNLQGASDEGDVAYDAYNCAKTLVKVLIEPRRVYRRPPSLALRRASGERQVPIVDFLCFCRRHVPKRAEQPMVVVPVNPFERCKFDILERTP